MNIKEELNKRVFKWIDDVYVANNIDPADPKMTLNFTLDHMEELNKLDKENRLKYDIIEIPEIENGVYGICKDETLLRLQINNKYYLVAVAERIYCVLGEYKWRMF